MPKKTIIRNYDYIRTICSISIIEKSSLNKSIALSSFRSVKTENNHIIYFDILSSTISNADSGATSFNEIKIPESNDTSQ